MVITLQNKPVIVIMGIIVRSRRSSCH